MRYRKLILPTLLALLGCNKEPDFEAYRERVRAELRDPASAEFRNEKLRTLWTAGGQQVAMYCAEVNAANAYGGKTGFRPLRYLISARNSDFYAFAIRTDPLLIDAEMTNSYYLDCGRPDTQRSDDSFGKFIVGSFDKDLADRTEPVLSMKPAPALR